VDVNWNVAVVLPSSAGGFTVIAVSGAVTSTTGASTIASMRASAGVPLHTVLAVVAHIPSLLQARPSGHDRAAPQA
jgi:hypothetical protein